MGPYWEYLHWAVYAGVGVAAWRYLPRTVVYLTAAFTRNEQRQRQCLEVLRLSRKDAAKIPSYLKEPELPPTLPEPNMAPVPVIYVHGDASGQQPDLCTRRCGIGRDTGDAEVFA
jgi:hypothetical protein